MVLMHKENEKTYLRCCCIHTDNCAGQNKSRFMLWYLCLLVWINFLTKSRSSSWYRVTQTNVCDGCFGCFKNDFRAHDVLTPSDVVQSIERSEGNTSSVLSVSIPLVKWKEVLAKDYRVPRVLFSEREAWLCHREKTIAYFRTSFIHVAEVKLLRAWGRGSCAHFYTGRRNLWCLGHSAKCSIC